MILSDEEVEARLSSPNNLVNVIQKEQKQGRGKGSTEIPSSIRDLIAITANRGKDTQKEVAEIFDVSEQTVSRAARGLVGERLDKNLQSVGKVARENREESAHEAALDVLMTTLRQIQPKLLDPELKPKELSVVAANMSKIASNMKNSSDEAKTINNTQVILFAPPRRELSKYEFQET